MGIQSLRTMELGDVNKYVRCLVALASVAIVMRVVWVVDVILQVEKIVHDAKDDSEDSGSKNNDPGTQYDDPTAIQKLDDSTIVSVGIQVKQCN